MKKNLLYLLLLFPITVFSQKYTLKYADVSTRTNLSPAVNHKIVRTTSDSLDQTFRIEITGVSRADTNKITLNPESNSTSFIHFDYDTGHSLLTFRLKDQTGRSFELKYNTNFVGEFVFDDVSTPSTSSASSGGGAGVGTGGDDNDNDLTSYISALANANFVGNNKGLANLTPIVNLGVVKRVTGNDTSHFSWDLDVNPYIGSEIDSKDSVSFIPALMLYGRAGIMVNNYLNFKIKDVQITFVPLAASLKFIPNLKDSGTLIIQHNYRAALGFNYANIITLGVQYTHGWHNASSESKRFYKSVFGKESTDIDYLTATGQFAIKGKADNITNYVFVEWRGLLSKKNFSAFTNNTILTIGVRKDLGSVGRSITASSTGGHHASHVRQHLFF
jgi:hypothetical protein